MIPTCPAHAFPARPALHRLALASTGCPIYRILREHSSEARPPQIQMLTGSSARLTWPGGFHLAQSGLWIWSICLGRLARDRCRRPAAPSTRQWTIRVLATLRTPALRRGWQRYDQPLPCLRWLCSTAMLQSKTFDRSNLSAQAQPAKKGAAPAAPKATLPGLTPDQQAIYDAAQKRLDKQDYDSAAQRRQIEKTMEELRGLSRDIQLNQASQTQKVEADAAIKEREEYDRAVKCAEELRNVERRSKGRSRILKSARSGMRLAPSCRF